jgi:hypothetical protein
MRRAGGIALLAVLAAGCQRTAPATPLTASPVEPETSVAADPRRPLVGLYDVRLELGDECSVLPPAERTRNYPANIRYSEAAGATIVTLETGTFLTGGACNGGPGPLGTLGCNQFVIGDDIDAAWVTLRNDSEYHGGQIVERTASGEWLEIWGHAYGPFDGRSIRADGRAKAWYCTAADAFPFPCRRSVSCEASLRITFTRR